MHRPGRSRVLVLTVLLLAARSARCTYLKEDSERQFGSESSNDQAMIPRMTSKAMPTIGSPKGKVVILFAPGVISVVRRARLRRVACDMRQQAFVGAGYWADGQR